MSNQPISLIQDLCLVLVGKQPSTKQYNFDGEMQLLFNTIAHLLRPLQATETAVQRPQKSYAQIIQDLISSSSAQNIKRIGSHAILTDRMLGKGHYGKVYLGYELPNTASKNTETATPSQFTPAKETSEQYAKVEGCKPLVDLTSLKAGSASGEKSPELLACKTIQRDKLNAHAQLLVQNEIQNLSMIKSPHIIGLRKYYKTHTYFYLFTELCNGGDLSLLKKSRPSGRLSEPECRIIMKKLVSGLRDLYEFDIVHRDLKLANILLHFPDHSGLGSSDQTFHEVNGLIECVADENAEDKKIEFLSKVDLTKVPFEIKIADFGFSKYLSDSKDETSGTMCGTPLYMSPQIVEDQRYTYKTDIWSLGVIYYELLTGKYPFHAEKMTELERNLQKGFYVMQLPYRPSVECLHIITGCLNQNEDERISIEELSELPYLYEVGYMPLYLNEAVNPTPDSLADCQKLKRSITSESRGGFLNKVKPFKMVLSSRDSRFQKQLSLTIARANSSPSMTPEARKMTTSQSSAASIIQGSSTVCESKATFLGSRADKELAESENAASMLEVIMEDEEERFAHHMRPSQVSFDITMDIKAQSITRRDPPQERKQSCAVATTPKNINVSPQQHQVAVIPKVIRKDVPFEEVKSPLPTQMKPTFQICDALNMAVDQILKEGQMTFGDASGFLMAAKDANFFEKIQTQSQTTLLVYKSPLIFTDYFAFA